MNCYLCSPLRNLSVLLSLQPSGPTSTMSSPKFKDSVIYYRKFRCSSLSLYSYTFDWILYIIIITVSLVYRTTLAPRYHEFSILDITIANTFIPDNETLVPNNLLVLISVVFPVLQIFFLYSFTNGPWTRKLWNMHTACLCFLASQSINSIVVSLLKLTVGAKRPDLLARCAPELELPPLGTLLDVSVCMNPDFSTINDGFKSFPSGHASTSFASAVFQFLLLASVLGIFDNRAVGPKVFLALLPVFIATFITATRYSDNRHFIMDLVSGAIVGVCSTLFSYQLYFPLSTGFLLNRGNAYPPRRFNGGFINNELGGFWRFQDDEEYNYDSRSQSLSELE